MTNQGYVRDKDAESVIICTRCLHMVYKINEIVEVQSCTPPIVVNQGYYLGCASDSSAGY